MQENEIRKRAENKRRKKETNLISSTNSEKQQTLQGRPSSSDLLSLSLSEILNQEKKKSLNLSLSSEKRKQAQKKNRERE